MAVSRDSDLPKAHELAWYLSTEEDVSLRASSDVFQPDGRPNPEARFSADRDSQLFTLTWPKLTTQNVSTRSQWRLVITKATDDRIASFRNSTAENLANNHWQVVKKVVQDCRSKFHARLLSMSFREIIFAHEDWQTAERMKNSNAMIDIMNSLLADVESSYKDIEVDWEVEITPVTLSLSYRPPEDGKECEGQFGSLVFTDGETPPLAKSASSNTPPVSEDIQTYFQNLMDFVAAESQKTHEALARMATENTNRHRFVCQKIEELKSSMQHLDPDHFNNQGMPVNQSEMELNTNYHSDSAQVDEKSCNAEEEDSIPSAELFEGPKIHTEKSMNPSITPKIEQPLPQPQPQYESHQPSQRHDDRSRESSKQRKQHDEASSSKSTSEVLRKDSAKPSESLRGSLSGSDLENRNLDEAVERAYRHDDDPPPKAKSYYTILCLDVSESMKENGSFVQMKGLVERFIDGVEDIVTSTGVEENIGVVTFGGTSNVVQNLTNDFSRVRDAIDNIQLGGRSPFVQALMVSMAAFVEKAAVLSVSGVYYVHPRIIFISDGYPTENMDDGGVDYAYNKMHVRTGLTRLMMDFARKEKYKKIHPVIYIPVGNNPEKELLKSMATLSDGVYMEPGETHKLCSHFLIHDTIGKTLACIERGDEKPSEQQIKALAGGLAPDLTEDQKEEVVKAVLKEQEAPPTERKHKSRGSDLEDMYENTDKVNAGEMLPLGTRVLRGPDWSWENQDGGGPGTVISHSDRKGWTWVFWDATDRYNRYEYGPSSYAIWKTDEHPRLMGDDGEMKIGMTVQKGPDWCYHDMESLHRVSSGIVIRKSTSKRKLMVRWDNAELQVVRWGAEDKYDVMYCNPWDIPKQAPLEFRSANTTASSTGFHYPDDVPTISTEKKPGTEAVAADPENGKWQWKDEDKNWNDYPPHDNAYIEKNYKRKSNASCIVSRDGKSRRIMFRRRTEKEVDSGIECEVRRIPV